MTAGLAHDVASFANTLTRAALASLAVIALLMIVLGLCRAWVGRRTPQIVLENMAPLEGMSGEVVSGLSPLMRQAVRRSIRDKSGDAAFANLRTISEDIESR